MSKDLTIVFKQFQKSISLKFIKQNIEKLVEIFPKKTDLTYINENIEQVLLYLTRSRD